jgi:hypothetical protein
MPLLPITPEEDLSALFQEFHDEDYFSIAPGEFQTCGTNDGIVPAEIEYHGMTPEEARATPTVQQNAEWWAGPQGAAERKFRKERKLERERCRQVWRQDQQAELDARKRQWASDAIRCGLPNPFPEVFD